MPSFPALGGPGSPAVPSAGGGGSAGPAWTELTSAMMAGVVTSSGGKVISVATPWALSGNTLTCQATTDYADGLNEGYCYAAPAAVMLAALGVTEAEMRDGEKTLLIGLRFGQGLNIQCNAGVALARSHDASGSALTLTGSGGGVQSGFSVATEIKAMSFHTSAEYASVKAEAWSDAAAVVRITSDGYYWSAISALQTDVDGRTDDPTRNAIGFYTTDDPIWLTFWVGSSGAAAPCDLDMSVWFAVVDGPNFAAVPA